MGDLAGDGGSTVDASGSYALDEGGRVGDDEAACESKIVRQQLLGLAHVGFIEKTLNQG